MTASPSAILIVPFVVLTCLGFPRQVRADHVDLRTVDHVIHISVDGLRGDLLEDLVANAPLTYPNFSRLETEGAYTYNARTDYFNTDTVPNHISMVTGRPTDQPAGQPNTVHHGYSNNFPGFNDTIHANGNPNAPYKASTFDVAHDHGLSTALYASKTRLTILDRSYDAANGAVDTIGDDNGRDKIDFSMLVDGGSGGIVNRLVENLALSPANYTFIHLVEPDTVGHLIGWENATWNAAVQLMDSHLGQIFDALDASPILSGNTAIILVGDHGGGVDVHRDPTAFENFNVPFFMWGAGFPANSDLYDLTLNRFNPGMARPDYNAFEQPWRNGDSGNLAMTALGLPPIPDAAMFPVFHVVPEPSAGTLAVLGLLLVFVARMATRRR